MKQSIYIIAFTAFNFTTWAQSPALLLAEADEYFNANQFALACPIYSELIKKEPLNGNINYKLGACYLQSRSQKAKASEFLEKAIQYTPALTNHADPKNTDAPLITYKLLGDAYCHNYKFDQAITSYEKYKSLLVARKINDLAQLNYVQGKIETCKFGKELKELVALPVTIKTGKLPKGVKSIDTTFRNCSSALSADKANMIFTYTVPLSKIEKMADGAFYEELTIMPDTIHDKAETQKNSYTPTPDTLVYVTTVGSSVDGHIVLTYKNDNGEGNLFITKLKNNEWSKPLKINKTSNLKGWEPHECVSPDGNTMYFVSNRKGGYGGNDIYKCKKDADGEWGKAVNMGPIINSPYNDEAPYIHPDGTTFFFSSNKIKPKDCFDNFIVSLSDTDVAGKPLVVGYPVDHTNENQFYQVAVEKKKGPVVKNLSSKKLKQLQSDSLRDKEKHPDNFLITFVNPKQGPLSLIKGQFSDGGKTPASASITVTDNETGLVQGVYHADYKTGAYSVILASGRNHNITFEAPGYLFKSENKVLIKDSVYFHKHTVVELPAIAKGSKIILNNVFFEDGKSSPLYSSATELNKVYEFLTNNPTVKVRLTNSIFTGDDKKFYKTLSEARVNAVTEELLTKGISQQRITAKSCRKSMPKQDKKIHLVKASKKPIQQLELEITDIN